MTGVSLFAGANTAQGFYSFYPLLARDDLQRVFILKGGPGTGKSTFMGRIIESCSPIRVERFHCSADANSLDAIYIREYGITIVDGTPPHVIEPRLPGAVQEIVDLGQCLSSRGLSRHREEILELTNSKSKQYQLAYQWLALAAAQADIIQTQRKPVPPEKISADAQAIAQLLPQGAQGQDTKAFASAITGNGFVSFLPQLAKDTPISVGLAGGNREYNNKVLQLIKAILTERKVPATYLYSPLQPQYLEHIYIPGVFGLYSLPRHPEQIQLSARYGPPEPPESDLEREMGRSLERAMAALSQAQELHAKLEKIYTPQVDFACVERQRNLVLAKIASFKPRSK